jgi:hypothetical protein
MSFQDDAVLLIISIPRRERNVINTSLRRAIIDFSFFFRSFDPFLRYLSTVHIKKILSWLDVEPPRDIRRSFRRKLYVFQVSSSLHNSICTPILKRDSDITSDVLVNLVVVSVVGQQALFLLLAVLGFRARRRGRGDIN